MYVCIQNILVSNFSNKTYSATMLSTTLHIFIIYTVLCITKTQFKNTFSLTVIMALDSQSDYLPYTDQYMIIMPLQKKSSCFTSLIAHSKKNFYTACQWLILDSESVILTLCTSRDCTLNHRLLRHKNPLICRPPYIEF